MNYLTKNVDLFYHNNGQITTSKCNVSWEFCLEERPWGIKDFTISILSIKVNDELLPSISCTDDWDVKIEKCHHSTSIFPETVTINEERKIIEVDI